VKTMSKTELYHDKSNSYFSGVRWDIISLIPDGHRCRLVDDPFLGDAGIVRQLLRIPVTVVRARLQNQICGDEVLHLVQGRRHPADPEGMGAEGREVLGRIERGIGDVVDLARVLQVLGQLRDDRQQGLLIGFVPGECLQKERDAVLIGRHPEDKLLEIPSVIPKMAVGDGHIAGVEVGVVRAADAERSGVVSTWGQCVPYSLASRHSATISLKSSVGPYAAIASSVRPRTSSLRCAVVTPSPRSRSTAMSEKNSGYR